MRYMLDTNICIYLTKHRNRRLLERFRACRIGEIGISSVVYSELRFGCEGSRERDRSLEKLGELLAPIEIVPFGERAADAFGVIRQHLKERGRPVGPFDTLIAAHAIAESCTLVTHNLREFKRIPGLVVENWV